MHLARTADRDAAAALRRLSGGAAEYGLVCRAPPVQRFMAPRGRGSGMWRDLESTARHDGKSCGAASHASHLGSRRVCVVSPRLTSQPTHGGQDADHDIVRE